MLILYITLIVFLSFFIKDMHELGKDIATIIKQGKTWFFGVRPRPQKPVKPTFKNALRAHTSAEQEAILCKVLAEAVIPRKRVMLQVLHLMNKDCLHQGHDMLFEKLLYEEMLTPDERQKIFSDYSHLEGKELDVLYDFINQNAEEARRTAKAWD